MVRCTGLRIILSTMKSTLTSLIRTSSFVVLFSSCLVTGANKPNILFIFADDQSYETIAALGNKEIRTPNLDRLVNMGTAFTNTYNMGVWNGAVCVASRNMLNTGRFVWRAHAKEPGHQELAQQNGFWSQLLEKSGYTTYMSGKWHVKIDPATIFNHVVNPRPGMPNQTNEGYNRPVEGELDVWSPYDQSFEGFWKGGKHWSEVLADDADNFFQNAAQDEKPFFMYLAFNAPHDPRQAPKRFVDMYPVDDVVVPASYQPLYPYAEEIGCGPRLRDEKLAPFPRTDYAVRVNRQEYFAIISHMDEQIGRILDALEKSGKQDNTYIFFTSDHGLACGHHGLIGKQNMYEHSVKPPLFVVGPGIPKGEKRDAMVYLQDVMATTLDLAKVKKPDYVEFNSLLPLINDPSKKSEYDAIYGCYLADKQRMIRDGDFKLIVYPQAKRVRLYDLGSDPMELNDLSGAPAQWDRVRSLYNRLRKLQVEMDDQLDLDEYFPELANG